MNSSLQALRAESLIQWYSVYHYILLHNITIKCTFITLSQVSNYQNTAIFTPLPPPPSSLFYLCIHKHIFHTHQKHIYFIHAKNSNFSRLTHQSPTVLPCNKATYCPKSSVQKMSVPGISIGFFSIFNQLSLLHPGF